jgi:hypothetical protein
MHTEFLMGRVEVKRPLGKSHVTLNQQNAHFLFIIQHNFFTLKLVQHVSDPYSGTIIRDPYRELHKITNQQIMVHIKSSKGEM